VCDQGATEWILNDSTQYMTADGMLAPLTESVRKQIGDHVFSMADRGALGVQVAHFLVLSAS
jgi:hypothetical protein